LNKRVLESLISAGAFDSLSDGRPIHAWRGGLHSSIDAAFARAEGAKRDRLRASTGLFGAMPEEVDYNNELSPMLTGWTPIEMLAAEKAALGFYITGHPLAQYLEILEKLKAVSSSELPNLATGTRVTSGGIISDVQLRTTKKGDKFALLRLEDETGGTKCVLWPEVYRKYSAVLQNELPAVITGRLELSEDNPPTIIVDQVRSIEASEQQNEFMVLRPPQEQDISTLYDSILSVLSTNPGDCEVAIETQTDDGLVVRIQANNALRVKRSNELEEALKKIGCGVSFEKEAQTSRSFR
jgi:DNA polymerase-3 subunit alpha